MNDSGTETTIMVITERRTPKADGDNEVLGVRYTTYRLPDDTPGNEWSDHKLRVMLEGRGFKCIKDERDPGYIETPPPLG